MSIPRADAVPIIGDVLKMPLHLNIRNESNTDGMFLLCYAFD